MSKIKQQTSVILDELTKLNKIVGDDPRYRDRITEARKAIYRLRQALCPQPASRPKPRRLFGPEEHAFLASLFGVNRKVARAAVALGIPWPSPRDVIDAAHRKAVKRCHPDRNGEPWTLINTLGPVSPPQHNPQR